MKTVRTVRGKELPVKECKKIEDQYYEIGVDCFKIGKRWYLEGNPNITTDLSTDEMNLKSSMHKGLYVDYRQKKAIIGYFSCDQPVKIYINARAISYFNSFISSEKIKDPENVFALNLVSLVTRDPLDGSNFIYCNNELDLMFFTDFKCKWAEAVGKYSFDNFNLPRNSRPYNVTNTRSPEAERFQEKHPTPVNFKAVGSLLNYSVGVEYESYSGALSDSMASSLGLVKLRDGSLGEGIEYATIPRTKGDAIYYNTIVPKLLSESDHKFDERCSLHVHLGGFPMDKLSVVCLWSVFYRLQNEIMSFLAPYRNTPSFMQKITVPQNKTYCSPIPHLSLNIKKLNMASSPEEYRKTLDEMYDKIYRFYSNGASSKSSSKKSGTHPHTTRKWEMHGRYFALNLVPLFFSNHRTVEFRQHAPTFNEYKIVSWIFICNAILNYTENFKNIILQGEKIELEDVLYRTYGIKGKTGSDLFHSLSSYINDRKNYYEDYLIRSGKPVMFKNEISEDYSFKIRKGFDFLNKDLEKMIYGKIEKQVSNKKDPQLKETYGQFTQEFIVGTDRPSIRSAPVTPMEAFFAENVPENEEPAPVNEADPPVTQEIFEEPREDFIQRMRREFQNRQ